MVIGSDTGAKGEGWGAKYPPELWKSLDLLSDLRLKKLYLHSKIQKMSKLESPPPPSIDFGVSEPMVVVYDAMKCS